MTNQPTTTRGIERSRSYRREKNSDLREPSSESNYEKYSTPGDRVVQSADIHVITQKSSEINNFQSRRREHKYFHQLKMSVVNISARVIAKSPRYSIMLRQIVRFVSFCSVANELSLKINLKFNATFR